MNASRAWTFETVLGRWRATTWTLQGRNRYLGEVFGDMETEGAERREPKGQGASCRVMSRPVPARASVGSLVSQQIGLQANERSTVRSILVSLALILRSSASLSLSLVLPARLPLIGDKVDDEVYNL